MNENLEDKISRRTAELEEQTELAKQASIAKSNFLAQMSHEIRTPMNVILGMSNIGLKTAPDDENLAEIKSSGETLLSIINDILDISKIESGHLQLNISEYETSSLWKDITTIANVKIEDKDINFILDISPDFPPRLTGDSLRIRQILLNLVTNAVKYTDRGYIELRITSRTLGTGDIMLIMSVADTGIGLASEDREKLFDKFTQLGNAGNRRAGGTGLGLAIVKEICEAMGGSIDVSSTLGKGSTFTATVKQTPTTGKTPLPTPVPQKFETSEFENFRVLIVDDSRANLRVAVGLMSDYHLAITTAQSGEAAIALCKEHMYDLIFMDYMMPKLDGVQTTKILRENGVKTPIIALTANVVGLKEIMSNEMDGYLSKPIEPQKIAEILLRFRRK
jgi:CheY-like chemotaxis protein/two-component sensor histidine kinase